MDIQSIKRKSSDHAAAEFAKNDSSLDEVRFVLFDEFTYNAYKEALAV